MSKLEDLVPDRKLCEQIPDGCFENTALAWDTDYERWYVTEREKVEAIIGIPAPTLAEILIVQPRIVLIFQYNYESDTTIWMAGVFDSRQGLISKYDANPTNAALELWLELNKSDLSDKSDQSDTDRKGCGGQA